MATARPLPGSRRRSWHRRSVGDGQRSWPRSLVDGRPAGLTDREAQVISMVAKGLQTKQVGHRRHCCPAASKTAAAASASIRPALAASPTARAASSADLAGR